MNTARGEIVDDDALCAPLESGLLGGACLDVVEGEPLEPERARQLAATPNLIITPHIAWLTDEALDRQFAGDDGRHPGVLRRPSNRIGPANRSQPLGGSMEQHDLAITGGDVVIGDDVAKLNVGVRDGRIA